MYRPVTLPSHKKVKVNPILANAFRNGRRYVWINYSKAATKVATKVA